MNHIIELITNPTVIILLFILFAGEYIPLTRLILQYIESKFQQFGKWFLQSYENRLYKSKSELIENKVVDFKINNFFAKVLFFIIATIIVVFIEIFWELGFRNVTKKIDKSFFAVWSGKKIKELSPYSVLILFSLPFIFMELIGIFAFISFTSGYFFTGVLLYIFKIFFFIPVHFVLHQGEKQLMSIKWFKLRYNLIVNTIQWFKRSQSYVRVHNISETIKAYMRAIKNSFFYRVTLIKKAFNHGEVLSPECQTIFDDISRKMKEDKDAIKKEEYIKFFDCVQSHLSQILRSK